MWTDSPVTGLGGRPNPVGFSSYQGSGRSLRIDIDEALILNGRSAWVGGSLRNRWWTALVLAAILGFFGWVGLPKLLPVLGLG